MAAFLIITAAHASILVIVQTGAKCKMHRLEPIMNKRKKSALHKAGKWPYLFCLPFLSAYFLFSMFPMLYSLKISFYDWNGFGAKTFVGIKNYLDLFTKDPLFLKSLGNTIILMAFSTPITVLLGLGVAYLLFDIGRGKRIYQTVNFFPYITTPVAIGFIFSYLFDWQSGYVNKLLIWLGALNEPFFWLGSEIASKVIIVIMIVWRYLGYYMTIYLAAMTSISSEVHEAAAVDGASNFKIFTKITVPMLRNTTRFLIITSLIGGLQMFEEPKLLFSGWASLGNGQTGGPGHTALTTVWKFFNDAFSQDSRLGYGSAMAYTLFVIIMLFSVVGFRLSRGKVNNKARRRIGSVVKQLLLIFMTLIMFFPLYIVFIMGTYYSEDIFKAMPILPSSYLLNNLRMVISKGYFQAYLNSIIVSVCSVAISVLISTMIGFALAKYNFKGKKIIFGFVMAIMMIPGQISLIGYMLEMRTLRLSSTLLPLIFTWAAHPLGVFLMTQFISDGVPDELLESGRLDGCSEPGIFFRLVVPCVKPGILTLSTLVFLWSWNNYVLPVIMINKQELFTIPLMVNNLSNSFRSDYGAIMCALALSVLPMIVIFSLCSKTFIKGIAAGAVKG